MHHLRRSTAVLSIGIGLVLSLAGCDDGQTARIAAETSHAHLSPVATPTATPTASPVTTAPAPATTAPETTANATPARTYTAPEVPAPAPKPAPAPAPAPAPVTVSDTVSLVAPSCTTTPGSYTGPLTIRYSNGHTITFSWSGGDFFGSMTVTGPAPYGGFFNVAGNDGRAVGYFLPAC